MTTLQQQIKGAITKQEARQVVDHFGGDLEAMATALWNTGKANTMEGAIEYAKTVKAHAEPEKKTVKATDLAQSMGITVINN